jgi:Na+-driven multidrug efflux pump
MLRSLSVASAAAPNVCGYLALQLLSFRSHRPRLYKGMLIFIGCSTLVCSTVTLLIAFFGRSVIINTLTTDPEVSKLLHSSWWLQFMAVYIVSLSMVFRGILFSRRHYATLLVSSIVSFLFCELPWMIFSEIEGKDIRFLGLVLILPWAISLVGCIVRIFLMAAPPHLIAKTDNEDLVPVNETEHYGSYMIYLYAGIL